MFRAVALSLALAGVLAAAGKKTTGTGRGESESMEITATVYTGAEAVKQLVGDDLGGHFTVIEVKVASRFGHELDVSRDNFTLRTDKDGEKSAPFAASQIAGRGVLVVSEGGVRSGGPAADNGGPVWGGAPGTMGRPRRVGGDGTGGGGEVVDSKAKDLELTYKAADGKISIRFK